MLGSEFSIFLEPYGAVYIDIAKVASSSLKVAFASVLGIDLAATGGNPHKVPFPRPPAPDQWAERLYPEHYTFGFVRNPWDRLLSCYRDKIGGEVSDFTAFSETGVAHCLAAFDEFSAGMSFEAFVNAVATIPDSRAEEHFRSQHDYLSNAAGDIAVDFVGRFENLASDFRHVAEAIRLPTEIALPHLQGAPSPVSYSDHYTGEMRDIVAARYADDIKIFSFQFD